MKSLPPAALHTGPKPATQATIQANRECGLELELDDVQDFADAKQGLVAVLDDPIVRGVDGNVVWDATRFHFIDGAAPETVNPSLWRQEQLNNISGLFEVSKGIYQIRGYDISNMTLVEGRTGWIVIDPLLSAEVARATLRFALKELRSDKPVVAVIYTHSHADHFGGVRGVVDEADVRAGRVAILAPEGFMEHAVAENVLAGNAMWRRLVYQSGGCLQAGVRQAVGSGLGKPGSRGTIGLIPPTDTVHRTGETRTIDGVDILFQMAQGSEAPAEMMFYLPDLRALCLSEVLTRHMHNVYTLRGAQTRDALRWSKYANECLDLYPDVEVAFASHHWPTWGRERIRRYLEHQRDTYRFIHDEALYLANRGRTMDEIGNARFFPRRLAADASSRGYYGTLSHNLRAVYNFYLGYYDANPAHLHRLSPMESSRRYVDAMGGPQAALAKARLAFAAGDYRWVAEMVNHVVFTCPDDSDARALQADALEQLGYQAESGIWRNAYLVGARELREGVRPRSRTMESSDVVRAVGLEMLFDDMAMRLNRQQTDGLQLGANLVFTDLGETWALEMSNSVLNNTRGRTLSNPDVTLTLTRDELVSILLDKQSLPALAQAGRVRIDGDPQVFATILSHVDEFDPDFNIVTP